MIDRELIQRALSAWDSTPLPKASDGMMQEVMEDLRAALAPADYTECSGDPNCCPENDGFGCCKSAAPLAPALVPMTDEQIEAVAQLIEPIAHSGHPTWEHAVARAIEAAHGITP